MPDSGQAGDDGRLDWISGQATRLVIAAADGDVGTQADVIDDVGSRYGHAGVFSLCYGLAGAVHRMAFPEHPTGNGTLAGDQFALVQQLGDCPDDVVASRPYQARLWSARFVAAYLNGDVGTASSLFFSCLDVPEQAMENVAALIGIVGGVARSRERNPR